MKYIHVVKQKFIFLFILLISFLCLILPSEVEEKVYLVLLIVISSILLVFFDQVKSVFEYALNFNYSENFFYGYKLLLVFVLITRLPSIKLTPPSFPLPLLTLVLSPRLLQFTEFIQIVFSISCVFFIIQKRPRAISWIMTTLYIYLLSLDNSYGKIGNAYHLISLILIATTLGFTFFPVQHAKKVIFTLLYCVISIYYFLAGFSKIYYIGGLGWINNFAIPLWILGKEYDNWASSGDFSLNILQTLLIQHSWLAYLFSGGALFTELSGCLVFILKPKYRIFIMIGLVGLHLGIELTMNISFIQNVFILLYLAYDWFVLPSQITHALKSLRKINILTNAQKKN